MTESKAIVLDGVIFGAARLATKTMVSLFFTLGNTEPAMIAAEAAYGCPTVTEGLNG